MSVVGIVIVVVLGVLALLILTGLLAGGRRHKALEERHRERIAGANRALAAAHAEDNGWAAETVETAAREAFAASNPGAPVDELHLVQVIDLPGTDDDQAVFSIRSGETEHTVTLGRQGGVWQPVAG